MLILVSIINRWCLELEKKIKLNIRPIFFQIQGRLEDKNPNSLTFLESKYFNFTTITRPVKLNRPMMMTQIKYIFLTSRSGYYKRFIFLHLRMAALYNKFRRMQKVTLKLNK